MLDTEDDMIVSNILISMYFFVFWMVVMDVHRLGDVLAIF